MGLRGTSFSRISRAKWFMTVKFRMPDDAYQHWLLGRKGRSVDEVVREAIKRKCKNPKPIREMCESLAADGTSDANHEASGRSMQIILELPAEEWEAAVQSVGRIGNEDGPVQTGHLLVAMIIESSSWRQDGDPVAKDAAEWHVMDLQHTIQSLTVSSGAVSLARKDHRLVRIIACATFVAAVAAVASAVAAWWGFLSSEHKVGPDASTLHSVIMESPQMSNKDIYEAHSERLNELRNKGRESAKTLRQAAQVLEQGNGRPEDDQLFYTVPTPDALLAIHTQIHAARAQMRRAMPQQERPDTSLQPVD